MNELLRGISHEGAHAFCDEYLGRPGRPALFAGRSRELASLRSLREHGAPRSMLCASAGRGKSALLLRFAQALAREGAAVAWAPISLRFGTHRSATVEALLQGRLRSLTGSDEHWHDQLASDHASRPLLVVLDGLDELQDPALLGALRGLRPGPGVALVASARRLVDRDGAGWARELGWDPCELLDLGPLDLTGIAALLGPPSAGASAAEVMARSGGDPLLARLCAEALRDGHPLPDVSDPTELVGAWWAEQRARLQAPLDEVAGRALAAVAAACGVVPWPTAAAAAGAPEALFREALAPFARFLVDVPGEGLTFAHPRFADVARWGMPDEVARAQQRYAALAVEARRGPAPHAYWMHFALPHLDAAGAPDELVHGLVTPASLAAWRRLEGSVAGFVAETRAAYQRCLRAQASAHGPALTPLLRLQARLHLLAGSLETVETTIHPDLRAALLRHGIRSIHTTLATIDPIREPADRRAAIEAILPALPDEALPSLLALASDRGWPRGAVVERLARTGAVDEALAHLLEDPAGLSEALLAIAPRLPDDATRRARLAIEQAAEGLRGLRERLRLLALLPPDEARRALLTIADEVAALDAEQLFYDEEYGGFDVRRLVVEALARHGLGDEALRWLAALRAEPLPWEDTSPAIDEDGNELPPPPPRWPDEVVRAHAQATRLLPSPWRERALAALAAQPHTRALHHRGWLALLEVVPTDAMIEQAWASRDLTAPYDACSGEHPWHLLSERAPLPLRRRLEQYLFALVEGCLDALDHLPEASADFEQRRSVLLAAARALSNETLLDPSPFFRLLPRWFAPWSAPYLAYAIARQARDEHRDLARTFLQRTFDGSTGFWDIDGAERFFSFDERRAMLAALLDAPLLGGCRGTWLGELMGVYRALTPDEAEAASLLLARAKSTAHDEWSLMAILASVPTEAQPELAERILQRVGPPASHRDNRAPISTLSRVTDTLRDPAARARFARETLRWIKDGQPPTCHGWDTAVMDALPRDEVERECSRIFAGASPQALLHQGLPLETQRKAFLHLAGDLQKPSRHSIIEKLWWPSYRFEEGESFRRNARAQLLRELDAEGGPRDTDWHRGALRAVIASSDADELIELHRRAPVLATPICLAIQGRALDLLDEGGLTEAQRDALEGVLDRQAALDFGDYNSDDLALRIWLYQLRQRPTDEHLAEVLSLASLDKGYEFLEASRSLIDRGAHELLALRATQLDTPELRLDLWDQLWGHLPEALRSELMPSVESTLQQLGDERGCERFVLLCSGPTLRALWWGRSTSRVRSPWFPLPYLRRLGGPDAVLAWAQGTLEAMAWFVE